MTRSYVIGDDVLTQAASSAAGGAVHHLLYDGHGSTRALSLDTIPTSFAQSYDFDAYGNALGDISAAITPLLYAGEYLASAAGQYYLRARHYDTANGRFNREDPFAGSNDDPQSLHKYAYTHSDPVNNTDPTGKGLLFVLVGLLIIAVLSVIFYKVGLPKRLASRHHRAGIKAAKPPTAQQKKQLRIAINILHDTESIRGSGVSKLDVDGIEEMLNNGLIWIYPDDSEDRGALTANGIIYLTMRDITLSYTVSENGEKSTHELSPKDGSDIATFPEGANFGYYYTLASSLLHEWQHYHYQADAEHELVTDSPSWSASYGKEVKLARAIQTHLRDLSEDDVIGRDDKIQNVQTPIDNAYEVGRE